MDKKRRQRIQKRKLLEIWGKEIRQIGMCEVCTLKENFDAHHILPKEYWKEYRFDIRNGICLCKRHHKFGKFSAHKNGMWFSAWLKLNKPDQYNWIIEKLHENLEVK